MTYPAFIRIEGGIEGGIVTKQSVQTIKKNRHVGKHPN